MEVMTKTVNVDPVQVNHVYQTKENILCDYYCEHFSTCLKLVIEGEGVQNYSLQQRLKTFVETSLNLYLDDKYFVQDTFPRIYGGCKKDGFYQKAGVRTLFSVIKEILSSRSKANEIPDQESLNLICQLLTDGYIGIVQCWLSDKSENFQHTIKIIERGLGLLNFISIAEMGSALHLLKKLKKTSNNKHFSQEASRFFAAKSNTNIEIIEQ